MSDDYNLRIREAMIKRVIDNDMLNGCVQGTESDNPEYARGIAEFIAATTPLSTEDGVGGATENILPLLYSIPQDEVVKYGLELAVRPNYSNVCAMEVAAFRTGEDAVTFAEGVIGVPARILAVLPDAEVYGPTKSVDLSLPVVGASVYSYNDKYGTLDTVDLY